MGMSGDSLHIFQIFKTNPSSRGRGVFGGGSPSMSTISFLNIMTEGNARDFGDLTYGLGNVAGNNVHQA